MVEDTRIDKKLMSEDTKKILLETTADLIRNHTIDFDVISKSIEIAASIENNVSRAVSNAQNINSMFGDIISNDEEDLRFFDFSNFNSLSKYRMIIGFLDLDFVVAARMYLTAQFQYEGVFAVRQLYVIANEGYKRIFGFGNARKSSLWVAEIGKIIDSDFPELKLKYTAITLRLEEYESVISPFRDIRDLSVHYNIEPMKVYDMMIKLDVDKTFREIIPFMNILGDMYRIVSELFIMNFELIIAGNIKFTRVFAKLNQQVEEYKITMSDQSGNEELTEE